MARLNKGFAFNLLNLNRKKTLIKLCATLILLITVTGCVSIKHDYPRPDSTTFQDTENTYLGRKLAGIADSQPPGYSGFYPLNNGIDALAARLILANRAERSIDLQYYLIKNDMVGKELLRTLLSAADRGVRIRLLLDDVFTQGYDAGITALDSHENIQIRIFNPFNRGAAGRLISSAGRFSVVPPLNSRLNKRVFV